MSEPAIINPGLVLAHARAWIGTPHARRAALRQVGADCIGLLRGIGAEIAGKRVDAPGWRDDWARRDTLSRGLGEHMVPLHRAADLGPGVVTAWRIGTARAAHVGVLSDRFATAIHVADYAGAVREDEWPRRRDPSSLWGFALPPGCERGPHGITPDDCLAVVYPAVFGNAYAEISLMIGGTPLARSAIYPSRGAAIAMLAPIYSHIETVE